MTNAAQDSDEYLQGLSDEWLFCRGWGHDMNRPSVRRQKVGPKTFEEIFDHAEANFGTRIWCQNGCGYHTLYPVYVSPTGKKIVEFPGENRYENSEYCVTGFRVSREDARAEWTRRQVARRQADRRAGERAGVLEAAI
ncbi:hypothetical protein [Amycolatopsis kentuckyensis]|uniref:hypothetical protein n=1 Tax=Amycolatopsis kentuckyensis TaxID=218823 RepID=UPI00356699C9